MSPDRALPIPTVTRLLVGCYAAAEKSAREQVGADQPDVGEEFITQLFHGWLRNAVRRANEEGQIEQAFRHDLEQAFPHLQSSGDLHRIASGLRVKTLLHPREVEKTTGGDLGIVLIRPDVAQSVHDGGMLTVDRDYRRGLLCQAKIKRRSAGKRPERWGSFTPNQRKLLPRHLEYAALLLYQYEDAERVSLAPFTWQLCRGATMDEVEKWLVAGTFPAPQDTSSILQKLGNDLVGTDDKDKIERYIGPELRPTLIVEIGWPPGEGPGATVFVHAPVTQQQGQQVHVHVGR